MIPAVAIPAFVALVFKLGLLGYSIRARPQNLISRLVAALVAVFVFQNAVEFVGLICLNGEITPLLNVIGRAYFSLFTAAMALLVHASFRMNYDAPLRLRRMEFMPYVPAAVLLYFFLATDQVVSGFQTFRSTMVRVPGSLYVLFEAYVAICLLIALISLVYGVRASRKSAARRARNRLCVVALLPAGVLLLYLFAEIYWSLPRLTSTIYLPIPLLLFLIAATYATHRYRVIDVGFYVPGSKTRKRKNEFYRHLRDLALRNEDVHSVPELLGRLAEAFHCPVAVVGALKPSVYDKKNQQEEPFASADSRQFPKDVLFGVDRTLVVDEVTDSDPKLYALMIQHKVGAIVPIGWRDMPVSSWLLFGEDFGDQVYTPLDFTHVEALFDRIGERLLDSLLPLRLELSIATENLRHLERRLAVTWDELMVVRQTLEAAEFERHRLREDLFVARSSISAKVPAAIASGEQTLQQYLTDRRAIAVRIALGICRWDKEKAARLLGISFRALQHMVDEHDLDSRLE